jgi:four helix bundle protein
MHKSDEILDDMAQLSVEVIKYVELKRVPYAVKDQLIKAVSGVGVSYNDAQNAPNKREFLHKVYSARKESSEAKYWLALVEKLVGKNDESTQLTKDIHGFYMMMQKIINTTKESTKPAARATSTGTRLPKLVGA